MVSRDHLPSVFIYTAPRLPVEFNALLDGDRRNTYMIAAGSPSD